MNMKRYFYCMLLCLSVGCQKSALVRNTSNNQTILQYIAQAPQLTLLNQAITRCHLDTVFASGGPFSFFCPSDTAFLAAGLTADKIAAYDPDSLSQLLKYNMLTGKFSSADLVGFLTEQATSLDTAYKPFIIKNYFGLFINGIQVTSQVELGDGVLLNIGSVNFIPTETVQQLLDSLPELSLFAAVSHMVPQFQALYNVWSPRGFGGTGGPGFTVMAPTNAAMIAYGFPTTDTILQMDPTTLFNDFQGSTINGFKFTSAFLGGFTVGLNNNNPNNLSEFYPGLYFAIAEDGTTVLLGYPTSAVGGPSQVPPHIIRPNILGTNGVIQEVDQVLH